MNGKITTLQGPGSSLGIYNPAGLSPFEAGLLFLGLANQTFPGFTWAEMISYGKNRPAKLSGWLTDISNWAGNVKDGIGDIISDTIGLVSNTGGDLVRLATDEQVIATVTRAAAAYASGGTSEALQAAMSALTPAQRQVVEAAGISFQGATLPSASTWAKNPIVWVLGGVTALSLGALILKKR